MMAYFFTSRTTSRYLDKGPYNIYMVRSNKVDKCETKQDDVAGETLCDVDVVMSYDGLQKGST